MKEMINLLNERKSVRIYKDVEIPKDIKEEIFKAMFNAPTAMNMQLYTIIDVSEQKIKDELTVICDNQQFIKDAKMILIFLADSTRYYDAYNEIANTNLKPSLADYYLGYNDCLIAAQNAVIAAQSLGIGSCYIGSIVNDYPKLKSLLNLPKGILPITMLTFGYPAEEQSQKPKLARYDISDIIFNNTYQEKDLKEMLEKKLRKNIKNTEEDIKRKTDIYINSLFSRKSTNDFYKQMNDNLKIMFDEMKEE